MDVGKKKKENPGAGHATRVIGGHRLKIRTERKARGKK